jgi:phosphatidylserine decarboxylase
MAHRVGGWLPQDPAALRSWINKKVQQVKASPVQPTPVAAEFKVMVIADRKLYILFNEMLSDVYKKYGENPAGHQEIRDVDTFFLVFDSMLVEPPPWDSSAQIGTPTNAVLDWLMGTKAGFAAFLKDNVNQMFKKMLNH